MTFLGIVMYKKYFMKSSWRSIYVVSSLLTTIFSCFQLILIFQWNEKYLHISNYPFAMGDDVIQQFLGGIQFLPSCIMYMSLCPSGSEGATYSMLTTFGNIALVVAMSLSSILGKVRRRLERRLERSDSSTYKRSDNMNNNMPYRLSSRNYFSSSHIQCPA